ncbi:MAG: SBBP repeat-containing protein, partial [Acidimicrobiales bacterium]
MLRTRPTAMALALALGAATLAAAVAAPAAGRLPAGTDRLGVGASLTGLPVRFEPNQGQFDPAVRFVARAGGTTLFLTDTEVVAAIPRPPAPSTEGRADRASDPEPVVRDVVRMGFAGRADATPAVEGAEALPGVSNYLLGDDPVTWRTGVPGYAKVRYRSLYPGIDAVFYAKAGQVEYDFVVAPGADPSAIALAFSAAGKPALDGADLVVPTGVGQARQPRPVLYQEAGGTRRPVDGGFVVEGERVTFRVGDYDRSRSLVIDPVLAYSTYLGGAAFDTAADVALDASGSAYLTGVTTSADFPTRNAVQPVPDALGNVFVTKLSPDGSSLVYSTYLGGSDVEQDARLALDGSGNAYVAGWTKSVNFPTTVNAYDRTCGVDASCGGGYDVFVTRLNAAGSAIDYSTYLGGSAYDKLRGIAVKSSREIYVTGSTRSPEFPTRSALQPTLRGDEDAFVAKLDTAAPSADASLVYSTYLGGTTAGNTFNGQDFGWAVAVDTSGFAYVVGQTRSLDFPVTPGAFQGACASQSDGGCGDAFVAKIDQAGSALVYSTYLGGNGLEVNGSDVAFAVAVDGAGNGYVAGTTSAVDFPTTTGAYDRTCASGGSCSDGSADAFVTKVNPTGSGLVYSTFLGGSSLETANDIALDASGGAYVTGSTASADFPSVRPVMSPGGSDDVLVAKLNATGSALDYATPLGGSKPDVGRGIAVRSDASGTYAYVAGETQSADFPTTADAFQPTATNTAATPQNGFLAKLGPGETPVVTRINPRGGPTSGGTAVVITGSGLDGTTAVRIGGVSVSFTVDGPTQITAVTPPHTEGNLAQNTAYVTVTSAAGVTSLAAPSARYIYGDGLFRRTPDCPGECRGAVALRNGKVLVGTSQLYDPATGTWSATGACGGCLGPVYGSSATVLADGRVLWTGGGDGYRAAAAAFVYDPATGTWSPTGSMNQPRAYHTATLLPNGKVLAAAGCRTGCLDFTGAGGNDITNTAELYEPATGTWTPTGSLAVARHAHSAALLEAAMGGCANAAVNNCGKVVAAGGMGSTVGAGSTTSVPFNPIFASAELYDPATGIWSPTGSMVIPRHRFTATQLPGGRVLAVGGRNGPIHEASAELYDALGGSWVPTASASFTRLDHFAARLPNGQVLVLGGADTPDVAELYDGPSATWRPGGVLSNPAAYAYGRMAVITAGPASACGTRCGNVVVASRPGTELYTPRPTVTGVAPTTARPGATVTLTGTGLASVTSVGFGAASSTNVTHDPTSP